MSNDVVAFLAALAALLLCCFGVPLAGVWLEHRATRRARQAHLLAIRRQCYRCMDAAEREAL